MTFRSKLVSGLALLSVGALTLAPMTASASWSHRDNDRSQWRDLAIGSGIVGVLGALSGNRTVATIGAAGALYSAYRYEELCDERGHWYHVERGRRIYDWDYQPVRDRDDWGRGRDRDGGHDRDWNRGRGNERGGNRGHDNDRGRDRSHDNSRGGRGWS